MKDMTQSNRIDGIDLLRGLSILSVILMHVNQRAPIEKTVLGQWLHPQIISCIFKNGYLGVIAFFVISDNCISTSFNTQFNCTSIRKGRRSNAFIF